MFIFTTSFYIFLGVAINGITGLYLWTSEIWMSFSWSIVISSNLPNVGSMVFRLSWFPQMWCGEFWCPWHHRWMKFPNWCSSPQIWQITGHTWGILVQLMGGLIISPTSWDPLPFFGSITTKKNPRTMGLYNPPQKNHWNCTVDLGRRRRCEAPASPRCRTHLEHGRSGAGSLGGILWWIPSRHHGFQY